MTMAQFLIALVLPVLACVNAFVGMREIRSGVASLKHADRTIHQYERATEPAKFWSLILFVRLLPAVGAIIYSVFVLVGR